MNPAAHILDTYLQVSDGGKAAAIEPSESFWQDLAGGAYPQLDRAG